MTNKFLNFIKEHNLFEKNKKFLIAVSGGVDSVVLLDLISKHFPNNPKTLIHVDHSIRNDTDKDVALINELSKRYNIKSYVEKVDVLNYCKKHKLGIEDGARKLRYKSFLKIFNLTNSDFIITAHNLNDLAENFIMRIIRGSGLDGLPGMRPKLNIFLKPMLCLPKNEIKNYAIKNNLKWREDYTNKDTNYTRNSIRHNIIPLLMEYNPKFLQSILRLSKILWMEQDHVKKEIKKFPILKDRRSISVNIDQLDEMDTYLRYEIIKNVLNILQGNVYGFEFANIKDIDSLTKSKSGSIYKKQGIKVIKEYDNLVFLKDNKTEKIYLEVYDYGKYIIKNKLITIKKSKNSSEVLFPLIIRNYKSGDRIKIKNGHKKINRFISDKKIPHHLRDDIAIVIDSNNDIILVFDNKFNKIFEIKKNYTIFIKECETIEKRTKKVYD